MAEAVILRAIESLDCWLVKKEEGNLEKLYSLIVGMSDLGEENKEMVHTLLLQFEMMIENEYDEYDKERKLKLYNLLDLKEEKMKSLVVGMADFWEDDKGKLYYLMFLMDTYHIWGGDKGELKKVKLCRFLIEMTDLWGGDEGELKKEKLHSLLIEITDMWGGDVRELNKEKLYSLLIEIIDLWGVNKGELNKEKLHRLLVERELNKINLHSLLFQMLNKDNYSKAGLGKDKQPKSNKEKLYTWLDNLKQDLCGAINLFCVLLDTVLLYDSIKEGVERAKGEFRMILDLIRDKKLGEDSSLCYISDVVDMAHHAHFLIQLQDSDPFPFFFELLTHQALEHQTYYKWLGKELKHIAYGLQEIKVKVEKVGSNMAEAVILWAIKSLECWLRKKGNLVDENLENLYSLIVGMSDLGEEKEIVHSLLLHFGKETFEYEGVRNLEKLYSLTFGMSDLGEEKKEMLHRLLWLTTQSEFRTEDTVHMFYDFWI